MQTPVEHASLADLLMCSLSLPSRYQIVEQHDKTS